MTESEKLQKKVKSSEDDDVFCEACHITYKEDQELGLGRVWVECDLCQKWMHTDCLSYEINENDPFFCPKCHKND